MNKQTYKIILPFILALLFLYSCEEKEFSLIETIEITMIDTEDFLFNLPIKNDTVFFDKEHNIDFRIELNTYTIDSISIHIDNDPPLIFDTTIINTEKLNVAEGNHDIFFTIWVFNDAENEPIQFQSKLLRLLVMENIAHKFISVTNNNGNFQLAWPNLDKKHTQEYQIIKYFNDTLPFNYHYTTIDTSFVDEYYVGEEASYIISVLNDEGNIQDIWKYNKSSEFETFTLDENPDGGFTINFSSCVYTNNFDQFQLTTPEYQNPEVLYTLTNPDSVSFIIQDAAPGDVCRYWLRALPIEYPDGVSENNWIIYSNYVYSVYGIGESD